MRLYISAETVPNLTASAIGLEFFLQQKASFCLIETKCMLFRPLRGISVAASTAKRNLLGVVTETYLRFSRLDQLSDHTGQHFFFGAGFPEDFLAPTVDTRLDNRILQNLSRQSIQPSWCLVRIAQGYVFVMQSATEQRTLLEWIPKHDGRPLQPEAQQQRFVEIDQLFICS